MQKIVAKISEILIIGLCIFLTACDSGGGSGGSTTTFSIGGTISGLKANTSVVLKDNGGNPLTITQNGNFQFSQQIPDNGNYVVTVATQPTSETCTVTNGDGANIVANVTNINITCSNKTFTIGGTVSGLNPGSQVVLNNNNDNPITITQDGKFTFTTPIAFNSSYSVVVVKNPSGEICTAQNSIGYGVTSNIANIVVNCSNASFSIGGTVTGLLPGQQVTLKNNGTNALLLKSSGSFTFSTPIAAGGNYLVSVATEPANQTCTATNNQGSNVMANVSTVTVICHKDHYTVSGTVNGLLSGAQITLLNNGVDPVILLNNGATNYNQFSFSPIAYGSGYNVTVGTQPDGESCTVTNSNGTNIKANVSNITVNCTQNYFSLYSFQRGTAGEHPNALLLASDKNFYSTTIQGGAYGKGTIFKITPSGTEALLYSFKGSNNQDGSRPITTLIQATDGNFYGTTYNGGNNGNGTIFQFNPNTNLESIIYSFSGSDGSHPEGAIIQDGNYLYGTTYSGGDNAVGTVFQINLSGTKLTTIYSFKSTFQNSNDGNSPYSGLFKGLNNTFYGTTSVGGNSGNGTVYSITTAGNEVTLYSFLDAGDAQSPGAGVIQANDGNLYGTVSNSGPYENGSIFKISLPSGVMSTLYSFNNGQDGNFPLSGLIQGSDNDLYGTTSSGGSTGSGTIYKISLLGNESVLYSFKNDSSIFEHFWNLSQYSDGSFYGTTYQGGDFNYGTVFKFVPQ